MTTRKSKAKPGASLRKRLGSVWLFPAILTLLLALFTVLGISGSSIGVHDALLQEDKSNLVSGTPRVIRSDEWATNTPLTFAQSTSNFPVINQDIGGGQDMSVVLDVPYKEWSILFKPQNLIFFLLPLANAFAFKWWFLAFVLMLSIYFFFITVFSRKLVAALLAVFFTFNPFIQWWYQSITILPIAYTFLILALAIKLVQTENTKYRWIYTGLIAYSGTCFALIMYPPFQIPCAIAGLSIFIAWYLSKYPWRHLINTKLWIYLLSALLISGGLVLAFLASHQEAIKATLNTVYPGNRDISSGGESIAPWVFEWAFNYELLNDKLQLLPSENSRFMLLGILTLPYLIYRFFFNPENAKNNRYLRMSRYLLIASIAFIVILAVRTFIPGTDFLYKFTGIDSIPHKRLLIGFGVVNLLLMALAVVGLGNPKEKIMATKPLIIFGFLNFLTMCAGLLYIKATNELPTVGNKELIAIIFICSSILTLLVHPWYKLRVTGLSFAVIFALFSAFQVNPLYKGTGSLVNGTLAKEVSAHEMQDDQRWLVDNYFPIENLPVAVGAEGIGGTYNYPRLELWEKHFPDQKNIYNRYAHVNFAVDDKVKQPGIELKQDDLFLVKTNSCSALLRDFNVGYIISARKSDNFKCFSPVRSTPENSPFVIYKRDNS